jgi:hypothetical protein
MNKILSRKRVGAVVEEIFGKREHEKRKATMADIVFGILFSPRLSITAVGRTIASHLQASAKYSIKRVDRFLGNHLIRTDMLIDSFCRWLTENRREIVVSLDWTEYGIDRHHRLAVNLITDHGRATPLLWQTYDYGAFKNRRSFIEREILRRLKRLVPGGCHVTVLADRGFVDGKLMRLISTRLTWDYVIRLRSSMLMRTAAGIKAPLSTYLPKGNRAVAFRDVLLTARDNRVRSVIIVKDKDALEPWYLASNIVAEAQHIIALYRRRFTCEEQFRDEKDSRFGLGTKQIRVSTCERRDRMLLVNALATVLLTLLGAVGEKLGYDKKLRANTEKKRTHSLFRQGREYVRGVMLTYVDRFKRRLERLLRYFRTNSTPYAIC